MIRFGAGKIGAEGEPSEAPVVVSGLIAATDEDMAVIRAVITIGELAVTAGIVVVAIAALAAAVWLGVKAYQYFSRSEADVAKEQANLAQKQAHALAVKNNDAQQTAKLVAEYKKLHESTGRTADETKRMDAVLQEIGKRNPELISGWNAQKGALGLVKNAYDDAAKAANNYNQAARNAAIHASVMRQFELQERKRGLVEQRDAVTEKLNTKRESIPWDPVMGAAGSPYIDNPPLTPKQLKQASAERAKLSKDIAVIDTQIGAEKQARQGIIHIKQVKTPSYAGHTGSSKSSHTGTGSISTSSYRVPSSSGPAYKAPPPTADEKADARMGQWETAINAKKAGIALPKNSWEAGFDTSKWKLYLTNLANGWGSFTKTSVAMRLKAKLEIDRINAEEADEYNQSLEKQAVALDEQHARGILSDKDYFDKYAALLAKATNNTKASAQTKNTLTDKATSIRISQLDAEYKAGKITQEEYIKGLQEIVDRRGIYANAEVSIVQGAQAEITRITQANVEKQAEIWKPNVVFLWIVPVSNAWAGCMAA